MLRRESDPQVIGIALKFHIFWPVSLTGIDQISLTSHKSLIKEFWVSAGKA